MISVDTITNNSIRPNFTAQTTENVKLILKHGINLELFLSVYQNNYCDIIPTVKYYDNIGVKKIHIHAIKEIGNAYKNNLSRLSIKNLEILVKELMNFKSDSEIQLEFGICPNEINFRASHNL